ncbi:hypothetical protein NMS98_003521 [Vibrio cholerae]|nr:hypothetical protein [Vibrio cholerae]
MFGLFKKKPKYEIKKGLSEAFSPFEILLPEEKLKGGTPDLRIGSKVLDLLRLSNIEVQTLEMFEGLDSYTKCNTKK